MARQAFGAIDRQRSGRWRARYTHPHVPFNPDGSPNRIAAPSTFRTKGEARDWLAAAQADIARGVWRSPEQIEADRLISEAQTKRERLTFGDYAATWMTGRKIRPTTRRAYDSMLRTHLLPRWGEVLIKEIRTAEIRVWLSQLAPGAPVMRKRAFELFATILGTANEDDLLAVSPVKPRMLSTVSAAPALPGRKTQTKREPRALSASELSALADAVPDYLRLPVLLTGTVGLRSGELRALTGESLEVLPSGEAVLHVSQAVTGRGKDVRIGPPKTDAGVRTVPVPESLREALVALADKVGAKGLLFPARTDATRVMPERTYQTSLAAAGERAGIGRVLPHDLRHTAASLAIAAGAAPTESRDLLGHTTVAMTARYTHTSPEVLARIVAAVDQSRTEPQADNVVPMIRRGA